MFLLGLNIGLVASSIVSFWISQSLPRVLAITCGIVGGVTLFSRYKAWKTGTVKHFYDLIRDDEEATKKLRNLDILFWVTSGYNMVLFLWYMAKS